MCLCLPCALCILLPVFQVISCILLALILHLHLNPSKLLVLVSFSFQSLNLRIEDLLLFSLYFCLALVYLGLGFTM